MIEFAIDHCDLLNVLVCASTREKISGKVRSKWISETFRDHPKVIVTVLEYDETVLPNTSESSIEVSRAWAREFSRLFPDMNLLFTSEPYGDYVARFMHINHISFDTGRNKYPISGSEIRKSLYNNWDLLPNSVKHYFQKKIVILGTESVGKSTLADHLSNQFRSSLVHELARDLIPNSTRFTKKQLKLIAEGHSQNIMNTCEQLEPLVFIDTDVHITQSYAKYAFGSYLDLQASIYHYNCADIYLYLHKDVPYIQDGTRLEIGARNELDRSHRETLKYFGIQFMELSGSYEEQNQTAVRLVKELVNCFY